MPPKEWAKQNQKVFDGIQKDLDGTLDKMSSSNSTSALSDAGALFKNWSVSDEEVEKAYQALAGHDLILEAIAGFLKQQNKRQSTLYQDIMRCHQAIDAAYAAVADAVQTMRYFSNLSNTVAEDFNTALTGILEAENRKAYEHIAYYHYLLTKAYEGYFLKPSTLAPRIKRFAEELDTALKTLGKSMESTGSLYEKVMGDAKLIEAFYDIETLSQTDIAKVGNRNLNSI